MARPKLQILFTEKIYQKPEGDQQQGDVAPRSRQPEAAGQQSAAAEPMPLKEEDVPKPEEPEDDPFEDIFKIFNKRD